ncbi:MAG: hypothetical protein IPM29_17500 [Planctomycetes bacterium]|nr:hypothetical protein [Planctomycetota bacterium]
MATDPTPPSFDLPAAVHRLAVEVEGWLELGATTRALEKLAPLLRIPAARPVAQMLEARAMVELGRYADALLRLDEIARYPHDPEWLAVQRAWCQKRLGDLRGAAGTMLRLLVELPRSAIGHYNLGCYLALLGDVERALDEVTLACGLEPEFREHALDERDLDPLRDDPRFAALIAPDDEG